MRQGKGRAGASDIAVDLMDKLVRWSLVGLKVSAAAFAIGTGYVLWGIYGGFLEESDPQALQRTLGNLQLMGQIMTLGGGLATICLVVVSYEEVTYAVVAGLVGAGYIFGFPMLVSGQLERANQDATNIVTGAATLTGEFILVVVGVRILIEIVRYVQVGPTRRASLLPEQEKAKARLPTRPWYRLSRCWELPFCHDAIKEFCPAFTAKKNCWRLKLGCNCDPHMIEALIRGGGAQRAKADVTSGKKSAHEAYVRSDLTQDRRAGKAERTRQCKDCPIFNEHQREKFRVLNPIIIAATVVGLFAAYPLVQRVYRAVIYGMADIASRLAYGTDVDPGVWFQRLDTQAVRVFFFIILFLLALSYVLKFIEWAILVKKV